MTTLETMFGAENINCAYDAASNSLLFSGDDRDVYIIKVAAEEIDRLSAAAAQPKPGDVRLGPLGRDAKTGAGSEAAPQTVVFSAGDVALETLEKVATGVANAAGSPAVTVVADAKSSALILTGDARAIEMIVERLEALRAKLRAIKPGPAK